MGIIRLFNRFTKPVYDENLILKPVLELADGENSCACRTGCSAARRDSVNMQNIHKIGKRGFTLIELLVVIAIIALLAAILFPVFGRARENARRISCMSNMKQIGLGILQYSQDYDEFLPPSRNSPAGVATPWQWIIQPYLKSTQLFKCPSNQQTGRVLNTTYSGNDIPRSYYSNAGYTTQTYGPGGTRPMADNASQKLAALESTSTTILIAEREDYSNKASANTYNDKLNDSREIFDSTNNRTYLTNHLGMSTYTFADGHAKAMKPSATITPLHMWLVSGQATTAVKTDWRNAIANAEADMNKS